MNRYLIMTFIIAIIVVLKSQANAFDTNNEKSLVNFYDSGSEIDVSWNLNEGIGVWRTCGGPFKPVPGEYVVQFHGCTFGRVTDRVSLKLPYRCHDKFGKAVLGLTKAIFTDLGYKPYGETLDMNEWPLDFRREKREAAWRKNKWYEIHYAVVDIRFHNEIRASFRYQAFAGPQNFEDEMRDVSKDENVRLYFKEEVERWTRIVRFLQNQFIGKCADEKLFQLDPKAGYQIDYISGKYGRRFVISAQDLEKYFRCDKSTNIWCLLLSSM
jgi:hypothetical protein